MVFKLTKPGGVVSFDCGGGGYQPGQKRLQRAAAGAGFWQRLCIYPLWREVCSVQSPLMWILGS